MNVQRARLVGIVLTVIGVFFYASGSEDTMSGMIMIRTAEGRQNMTLGLVVGGVGILFLLASYVMNRTESSSNTTLQPLTKLNERNNDQNTNEPIFSTTDGGCSISVFKDRVEVTASGIVGKNSRNQTIFASDISRVAVKGISKQLFITAQGREQGYNVFGQKSEQAQYAISSILNSVDTK